MDGLRKVEVDGEWWAQRPDGSWLQWSRAAASWESRAAGPPGERPEPGESPSPELGPIDQWFNRAFPPNSARRLLFGLVALPIMGLAVAAARRLIQGEVFSLELYLFATLVGAAILALAWFGVVMGPDAAWRSSGRRAQEGRRAAPAVEDSPRFSPREFGLVAAILFVDLTLFHLIADRGSTFGSALIVSAPGAVLASLIWQLRTSPFGLLLLSALAGIPVGLVLTLLGVGFGHEGGLLRNWLMGSGLALLFFLPYWWGLRRRDQGAHAIQGLARVPPWVLWTGVSILMLSTGVFLRLGG